MWNQASDDMLKYNFAYDENRNIISIADVPEEGHLDRVFFCIGCGNTMVAAIGPKRRYFRHRTEDVNCSNESYLHKLAKKLIKQKFDDFSKPFNIQLKGKYECAQHCKLYNEKNCTKLDMQDPIDLHKYYNLCEEEKGEEGDKDRADLLLTPINSKNDPLFIEVKCTHECTEKKKEKHKIIEVWIKSEKDIYWLIENTWKELDPWAFDSESRQVKFINFNPQKQNKEFCDPQPNGDILFNFSGTYQNRFVYYPSRKFYIENYWICYKSNKPYKDVSILELNVPSHTGPLEIAHYLKRTMNIELRACSICRYFWEDRYGLRHCNLKSKYETIETNDFFALDCSSFQLNWLNSLYKYLPEEQRLKDYQVEIIKK